MIQQQAKTPFHNADALAEALRGQDTGLIGSLSPTAACLVPMLSALSWNGDLQEVAETLPHFADDLELVDLRNVFARLGYSSTAEKTSISDLDPRLLPCLFETKEGEAFALLEYVGGEFGVFRDGKYQSIPVERSDLKGTVYTFTKESDLSATQYNKKVGWFTRTLLRFTKPVRTLLITSLVANLAAILVPLFVMTVYDRIIGTQSTKALPMLALGMITVLVVDLALRRVRALTIGAVASRMDYLTGTSALAKILSLPALLTERSPLTAQLSRLRQFESLRDFFTGPLATNLLELPFVFLMLGVIAVLGGPLVLIPIVGVGLYAIFGWAWLPAMRRAQLKLGDCTVRRNNFVRETFTNLRTIKEIGAEDIWRARYRHMSADALTHQTKVAFLGSIAEAFTHGVSSLMGVAVLGFGAMSVLNGSLSIGGLIAVMALTWRALAPLQSSFTAFTKLSEIKSSMKQVDQLMRLKSEGDGRMSRLLTRVYDGDIRFNRVSFKYSAESDPALLGANLLFEKGTINAVIGANSAGKSTVLKLILGLYQPQGGTISIAGLDVRQIDPVDLRRKIAYIPQQTDVFYGTIRQNLRLADPLASEERLRWAVEKIGLLDTIDNLPEGFDTRIGDRNTHGVSEELIHRLAIARGLLRDVKIMVIDEPEQTMDVKDDEVFIQLLNELRGEMTVIMVSHRPSYIRQADKAFVINNGIIEFAGIPDQALQAAQIIGSKVRAA